MNIVYQCTQVKETSLGVQCVNYVQTVDYSSFKLSYEQMGQFIFAVALIYATVFAVKVVKRSFF